MGLQSQKKICNRDMGNLSALAYDTIDKVPSYVFEYEVLLMAIFDWIYHRKG
jgi:hypothetical protein